MLYVCLWFCLGVFPCVVNAYVMILLTTLNAVPCFRVSGANPNSSPCIKLVFAKSMNLPNPKQGNSTHAESVNTHSHRLILHRLGAPVG